MLMLAVLAACDSQTQPELSTVAWTTGAPVPHPAYEPGVTAFGQQIAVVGGFDRGTAEGLALSAEVDVYDLSVDQWSSLADAPVAWSHINLAAIADSLYILGGLDGTGPYVAHGEAYRLDPVTRAWVQITSMDPGDERGAAGVITTPGHIFLLGGMSASAPLASCLEYDIATGSWLHLPDLPEPLAHPAAMQTTDGYLIAATGLVGDGTVATTDVWALSPAGPPVQTWGPRAPAPNPHGGCAYGVLLGDLACAGGGTQAVDSYDPYLDVWTPQAPLPEVRTGTPGAATTGRLFVPGGAAVTTIVPGAAIAPLDSFLIFEPLATSK
jgi:hypothetical protein